MTMTNSSDKRLNPDDFIITRKRKLYKFAAFQNMDNCYDDNSWKNVRNQILDKLWAFDHK